MPHIFGRRLLGILAKLLVLLAAEVIGIGFYGLLAEALPEGGVRRALAEMCGDERHHLRFHVDFFRRQTTTPVRRLLFLASWWLVVGAAALTVLFDHRRTLRLLGARPSSAAVRLGRLLLEASARAAGRADVTPRRASSAPAVS